MSSLVAFEVAGNVVSAVMGALAKPEFKWRTIAGVAKETGFTEEQVLQVINAEVDRIVRSSVPSTEGQDLYATRDHCRKKASLGERILGVIGNRAV